MNILNESDLKKLTQIKKRLALLKAEEDALENEAKEIESCFDVQMQEANCERYENDDLVISYSKTYTRSQLDNSKLKNEYPEIAKACTKNVEIKGKLTVKMKKEKEK